jgi:DNA-directed RNA polymerase sigma subunit (sigma70/sigma32)
MSKRDEWWAALRSIAEAEAKSDEQARELKALRINAVRQARAEGLTLHRIGQALGVTRQRVHQILKETA